MSKGSATEAQITARRQVVGRRIRKRRLKRGITQVGLAHHLKVSQAKVSRMEAGCTEPDYFERQRLAKLLDGLPGDYRAVD